MDRRNTNEIAAIHEASAIHSSSATTTGFDVSLRSTPIGVVEAKTVDDGIRDAITEMEGMSIAEKLSYIHKKVTAHSNTYTQLSGTIRCEIKEYFREFTDAAATLGVIKNNVSTIEHLVLAVKSNLKAAEDTFVDVRSRLDSTVKRARIRDGHAEFAVKLVEVASKEMESSLAELCARNSLLEKENQQLQSELKNVKPKMEIDLTEIKPLYRSIAEVQGDVITEGLLLSYPLKVSIEPVPSCSKNVTKEEFKPEIKMEIKPEVKSEMKVKIVSNSPKELVKKGQELLRWEEEKLRDDEYEKQAAMAREQQKLKQREIALKKEEAATRKSSEESAASSSNFEGLSTAAGTYRIRRIDNEYEINYYTRGTGQPRTEMLARYADTNWASMNMDLLKELLPDVTCVCFRYGDGIKQANESLPVHVDLYCNYSHVSSEMLDIPPIPCEEIEIRLTWGPYTRMQCQTYIDLRLSDPSSGKANHVERFYVVKHKNYPEFDIHRVTVGRSFVERYLKSKRASYNNGEMLVMGILGLLVSLVY